MARISYVHRLVIYSVYSVYKNNLLSNIAISRLVKNFPEELSKYFKCTTLYHGGYNCSEACFLSIPIDKTDRLIELLCPLKHIDILKSIPIEYFDVNADKYSRILYYLRKMIHCDFIEGYLYVRGLNCVNSKGFVDDWCMLDFALIHRRIKCVKGIYPLIKNPVITSYVIDGYCYLWELKALYNAVIFDINLFSIKSCIMFGCIESVKFLYENGYRKERCHIGIAVSSGCKKCVNYMIDIGISTREEVVSSSRDARFLLGL